MITTLPDAPGRQRNTDPDRPHSQRFSGFDLYRSRDCRRRHRVVCSAQKVTALFHDDVEDRRSR